MFPDFMASRALPLKLKPKSLEPLDNIAIPKAREAAHSGSNNDGHVERLDEGYTCVRLFLEL